MPCYRPLHAFKAKSQDASKIKIVFNRTESWRGETLDLPCGRCIGCRLERSRQWAVRCLHEASLWEKNCFITLTYNNDNIPKDGSLHLEHFQLFMKRLRKKYGSTKENPIRFFHCGEYGEQFARPHYHALLFNHAFDDHELFARGKSYSLYTSKSLSKLWPYGFGIIGDVTFESAGYVARYSLKKVTGDKAAEHYGEKRPEYCTMSRRKGIGHLWYEKYKDEVYPLDRVFARGVNSKPPRYYDTLLQKEDPSTMALIKIQREKDGKKTCTDVLSDGRKIVYDDNCDRRLMVKEEYKNGQMAFLKRHQGW